MVTDVTVTMPLHITYDMLQAVRESDTTCCEDKDEMNIRIGWLICAYEVLVEKRIATTNEEG